MRIAMALLVSCSLSAAASADDFSADMPKIAEFLAMDTAYSPAERNEAEAAFAALKTKSRSMSPAAYQLAVAHIAALAHNGHTMLPVGVWQHQFPRTRLQYHAFADGLYVVGAPDDIRDIIGARVTKIDGRDVREVMQAFGKYFGARENKRDEWAPFFLESPALLHAAGFAKRPDRVDVEFKLVNNAPDGLTLEAKLDPPKGEIFDFLDNSRLVTYADANVAKPAVVPFYLSQKGQAFLSAELKDIDAHYVQWRLNKSFYDQKIETFLADVQAKMRAKRRQNVIVDLRLDGGGDLNTTRDFLQALPKLVDGKIFVLTSGRTFSAGIASAGYVKQAAPDRVVIVGEPIGDFLEFWAEGGFIELPASKAYLLAATERHNYMTGCQEADCHSSIRNFPIRVKSLEPDIAVPLTNADYRAGRDTALEAVRKALGR
jgi:hypothetical protein